LQSFLLTYPEVNLSL